MCLITFSYQETEDYPLVLVANRDEAYDRPALAMHFWMDAPDVLAGRDLEAGGTWLGLTKTGKFIAITNQPFTQHQAVHPRSRGELLKDYLTQDISVADFTTYLKNHRYDYEGYHLIYGTITDLYFYENVGDQAYSYQPGIYSISNTQDDLSSYRMNKSIEILNSYNCTLGVEEIYLKAFADTESNPILEDYPSHLDYSTAQKNSAIFIKGRPDFGTVATTVILINNQGEISTREVRYDRQGPYELTSKRFRLDPMASKALEAEE